MQVKTLKLVVVSLLLTTALFISACSKDGHQDKTELAKLYVDILILEEHYSSNLDSLKFYKQKLFENGNISRQQYKNQISDLGNNSDNWKEFFKLSNEYLDTLKTALKKPEKLNSEL